MNFVTTSKILKIWTRYSKIFVFHKYSWHLWGWMRYPETKIKRLNILNFVLFINLFKNMIFSYQIINYTYRHTQVILKSRRKSIWLKSTIRKFFVLAGKFICIAEQNSIVHVKKKKHGFFKRRRLLQLHILIKDMIFATQYFMQVVCVCMLSQ